MTELDYWKECILTAADENSFKIPNEQLEVIAKAVMSGHENYGMAFYSPPDSDRYNEIEREWNKKLEALQKDFDRYQKNAETAVKKALRQYDDARVSIEEHGEVFRHGGRTEQIQ